MRKAQVGYCSFFTLFCHAKLHNAERKVLVGIRSVCHSLHGSLGKNHSSTVFACSSFLLSVTEDHTCLAAVILKMLCRRRKKSCTVLAWTFQRDKSIMWQFIPDALEILKEWDGNELTHSSLKIWAVEASDTDTVFEICLSSQQAATCCVLSQNSNEPAI